MKKTSIILAAFGAATLSIAQADLITAFTFEALSDPVPLTITSEFGPNVGTIYLDGQFGSSVFNPATGTGRELDDFGGTIVGDPRPNLVAGTATAGDSLSLLNSTANGKSIVLQVSTVGFFDISLSFASQRTTTGFNNNSLQYSTDGITFTSFETGFVPAASFALKTFDLSAISEIENQPAVYFQYTVTGATSASGNNRLDNIVVTGVPEPGTFVALLSGLGMLGLVRRRRLA